MVSDPTAAPADSAEQARLVELFRQLPMLVNADADLYRRGARCSVEALIGVGEAVFHLRIAEGKVIDLVHGPILMRPWQFAFRASAQAWRKFWTPVPDASWHDLFALLKRGEASLDGDIAPFMTHLQFFKDVLATPRRLNRAPR